MKRIIPILFALLALIGQGGIRLPAGTARF